MKNKSIFESFKEVTDRFEKINWLLIFLVALAGFVIIGSLSLGFYRGMRVYQKYLLLINASMKMRLEATTAYLWFEEMIGGDKSKNMDDILKHLDIADRYAKSMIEGGEELYLKILPVDDSKLRTSINSLQSQLKKQRELLHIRIEKISSAGPSSEIDKIYHSTLENFIKNAINYEMDIKSLMNSDFQMVKFTVLALIAFCTFIFLIVGYSFYRYERLKTKNYSERLKMERMLVQNEKITALGTMTMGIAHEINNPNSFISMYIPILKEYHKKLIPILDDYVKKSPDLRLFDMSYPEFREYLHQLLKNIENGSIRINSIVSKLKSFSQKKDKIKREWVDIHQVIEQALTICGPKIKSLVNSFEINVSENLPLVYCDSEIVGLILINFLGNAAEAIEKKGGLIQLNVFLEKERQNALTIEVRDNGSGINENNIGQIFEPFFSTKSSKGGTGMGLYLCRTLADQMQAEIKVKSELGKGSIFKLIIDASENTNM